METYRRNGLSNVKLFASNLASTHDSSRSRPQLECTLFLTKKNLKFSVGKQPQQKIVSVYFAKIVETFSNKISQRLLAITGNCTRSRPMENYEAHKDSRPVKFSFTNTTQTNIPLSDSRQFLWQHKSIGTVVPSTIVWKLQTSAHYLDMVSWVCLLESHACTPFYHKLFRS